MVRRASERVEERFVFVFVFVVILFFGSFASRVSGGIVFERVFA